MTYGPQLEQLSIRCEGSKTIKTILQHATYLQRLVIRHSDCNYNDVTNILKECESLNHLEMVSWPVQEVPTVVLHRVHYQAHTDIQGIRKTFALNESDLQEIRRLCLYQDETSSLS